MTLFLLWVPHLWHLQHPADWLCTTFPLQLLFQSPQ